MDLKIDKLHDKFSNNISWARTAYMFAVGALPDPSQLTSKGQFTASKVTFQTKKQVLSVAIELGWAFFCRYEACLERYLKDCGVGLSKNLTLIDWLKENEVNIPDTYEQGILLYRKLRNAIHHEDQSSLTNSNEHEAQLFPDHMERFYDLFCWVAQQVCIVRQHAENQ